MVGKVLVHYLFGVEKYGARAVLDSTKFVCRRHGVGFRLPNSVVYHPVKSVIKE